MLIGSIIDVFLAGYNLAHSEKLLHVARNKLKF